MKRVATAILILIITFPASGQSYKVTARQSDPFSLALVNVLNCAATRFTDCRGDSIRTTWLMGTDYKLNVSFPGSTGAIVRKGDWDVNTYIEFRGYKDKKSRNEGIKDLIARIKHALGDQLYDRYADMNADSLYFYGLNIKDANGYFSMNMELFGSTSSEPVYLLGPEREDKSKAQTHFILLKIYGGVPAYQYYIRERKAPDPELHKVVQQLAKSSENDFSDLRRKKADPPGADLPGAFKKSDTLRLHGIPVSMTFRGSNYSAALSFAVPDDSVKFNKEWLYYRYVLEAALGTSYVFYPYDTKDEAYALFYDSKYRENSPRVYLQYRKVGKTASQIVIRIQSATSHPTSAGLRADDID